MVAGMKIRLGPVHRGKVVAVVIEDGPFRILHDGIQRPPIHACRGVATR